ncbi:MAG: Erythromycin esterase [Methanosaeta sp. PtaB.Bin039]|nr:MAG: Erythromycin esterase [Methanosaeta sp. PtaB.Bin039]
MRHATLDDWTRAESITFSLDSQKTLAAAIDRVVASLDESVELLGIGEALHGGEEILRLRNQLFQRLASAHGYSAIAIESSFPRARAVDDYVSGRGPESFEAVQDAGFGHGFGRLEANRELVEWMRLYNSDPSTRVKLRFYGFDIPGLAAGIASPSQVLHFVLDYLSSIDSDSGQTHRHTIDSLLGSDFDWENPAAMADPEKSIGLSPASTALRAATEDLIMELRTRRPELVAKGDEERYLEAVHYAAVARDLLTFHAGSARKSDDIYSRLLGIRDASMADNLAYIVSRERRRGKVLAFAHNSHLGRGKAVLPWATWWPAGSHLDRMFGKRYAVIGSAVGVSEANGIGRPQPGTLEARLTALPGSARFIPTHKGQGIASQEIASLPVRGGSMKNPTYIPLTPQSFTDFDWLAVLDETTYSRGGPPLQQPDRSTT